MEQPLSLRGTCVLGLEPVQDSTRLLKGRRAYRAALCGLPGSPSRGQQWGHGPIAGTGAPAGARAAADGGSPPAPCCSRPCSGTPQRRTTCQATLWTSTGNTFSLVSEHVFLFFFSASQTREGAGRHKCLWFGTLQESLAGKYRRKHRDRVPWNAAFHLHHCRETGCHQRVRGRPTGLLLQLLTRLFTHIYALRSRTPSAPPESPQPQAQCGQRAALGWRHTQYRQGPSGRSEPARWGVGGGGQLPGRSEPAQEGGQLPVPAGVPRHLGPLCNHPAGSSGAPFSYRLRTFHMGTDGRHQRQQTGLVWKRPQRPLRGAEGLEHTHVSEGALPAARARSRGEGRHPHPRGQCLFSGT